MLNVLKVNDKNKNDAKCRCSSVFTVKFENIQQINSSVLLLTLNIHLSAGS